MPAVARASQCRPQLLARRRVAEGSRPAHDQRSRDVGVRRSHERADRLPAPHERLDDPLALHGGQDGARNHPHRPAGAPLGALAQAPAESLVARGAQQLLRSDGVPNHLLLCGRRRRLVAAFCGTDAQAELDRVPQDRRVEAGRGEERRAERLVRIGGRSAERHGELHDRILECGRLIPRAGLRPPPLAAGAVLRVLLLGAHRPLVAAEVAPPGAGRLVARELVEQVLGQPLAAPHADAVVAHHRPRRRVGAVCEEESDNLLAAAAGRIDERRVTSVRRRVDVCSVGDQAREHLCVGPQLRSVVDGRFAVSVRVVHVGTRNR
mmetsp:Transcript_42475/g.140760  ORF Transcript_42475/g.140760 Transcript_42475/m.140760 type:complete len:322 (-) Transcript_42475:268-1233(-)